MTEDAARRLKTLGALAAAVVAAVVIAGKAPHATASQRVPSDPKEVLATVSGAQGNDARTREIAGLRKLLATSPQNLRAALRLAQLDIQLARETSDPRYLGHAQATLAPWWTEDAPPPVLVLRATIEQSLHDFDSALRHLDLALAKTPNDGQAWLTRAVILTVRARYDEAFESCKKAINLIEHVAYVVCYTAIDSVTGKAQEAAVRVQSALARPDDPGLPGEPPPTSKATQEWAISSIGEYLARAGDAAAAESHFRAALAMDKDDAYVRGALADLLIDAGRDGEAAKLLEGLEANDGMLLRSAIAKRRGKLPGADEDIRTLGDRFGASRMRGDVVHRREESRYWLDLKDEPERALALAQANWEVQKEPWDARVLLAAAAAAHDRAAAAAVLAHLDRTKLEDPEIARLAKGLR